MIDREGGGGEWASKRAQCQRQGVDPTARGKTAFCYTLELAQDLYLLMNSYARQLHWTARELDLGKSMSFRPTCYFHRDTTSIHAILGLHLCNNCIQVASFWMASVALIWTIMFDVGGIMKPYGHRSSDPAESVQSRPKGEATEDKKDTAGHKPELPALPESTEVLLPQPISFILSGGTELVAPPVAAEYRVNLDWGCKHHQARLQIGDKFTWRHDRAQLGPTPQVTFNTWAVEPKVLDVWALRLKPRLRNKHRKVELTSTTAGAEISVICEQQAEDIELRALVEPFRSAATGP